MSGYCNTAVRDVKAAWRQLDATMRELASDVWQSELVAPELELLDNAIEIAESVTSSPSLVFYAKAVREPRTDTGVPRYGASHE